jgi:hypothetical protein
MKAVALILLLGVVNATQTGSLKLTKDLENSIRSHLSICTACHIATGVINDEAAVNHAKIMLQGYCNDVPPTYHKLCEGVTERLFENGFKLAQYYTVETNCESFCGENTRQFTTETLCSGITTLLDNTETIMDIFEAKVKSVCSTEKDSEGCFAQFQKWRPFITNFLKRSILRVVNEFEPKTLCNIDLTKIPKSDAALKMPKLFPHFTSDADSVGCTLCEYMFEGACEMLTDPEGYNAYRFAVWLNGECHKIALLSNICNSDFANTILGVVFPLINQVLWPNACHLLDKTCPVNPNPMCKIGS